MNAQTVLITGAAGQVAEMLRPRLAREGRLLRLLDVREPEKLAGTGAEEVMHGSVTDAVAMAAACQDVDAVIHLGGKATEADAAKIVDLNIRGTVITMEAARDAGVRRVVLASSNHAVGFAGSGQDPVPANTPGRPDTYYGLSKVAMEATGRMFADRYGMDVIALRIGSWSAAPLVPRALATWLSPGDGARLVEASLSTESVGFRIVWGISRNTRRWFCLSEGEAIGYHPVDDAETYAGALISQYGDPDFVNDPNLNRVGGSWCDIPLGVEHS